jgi:hypothetical protein
LLAQIAGNEPGHHQQRHAEYDAAGDQQRERPQL